MENFVSLSCPSCNASVRVDANKKTATCEFCGREFTCQKALDSPPYEAYQKYQYEKQLQGDDW